MEYCFHFSVFPLSPSGLRESCTLCHIVINHIKCQFLCLTACLVESRCVFVLIVHSKPLHELHPASMAANQILASHSEYEKQIQNINLWVWTKTPTLILALSLCMILGHPAESLDARTVIRYQFITGSAEIGWYKKVQPSNSNDSKFCYL